jgi:hypothetical protein
VPVRRRPLRALFGLLRGPVCAVRTAGARWVGLPVVAIDGTCQAAISINILTEPISP